MARELKAYQLIERSIIKKYRKEIWNPFIEAIKKYKMINEGDCVNFIVENDKKSVLCAKLIQQLKRVSEVEFSVEFIDNSNANLCEKFNVPTVNEFSVDGKKVGLITFTDVVKKALDSILNEGKAQAYLPVKDGTINPLFCIKNESINAWVKYNELDFELDEIGFDIAEVTPDVEHSIFNAVHAVCLDTIIGYTTNGEEHSFLDKY